MKYRYEDVFEEQVIKRKRSVCVFICEECGFESKDSSEMGQHSKQHFDIENKRVCNIEFYKAADKESLGKYLDICYPNTKIQISWAGAGWYTVYDSDYNDFDETILHVQKADEYINNLRENVLRMLQEVQELQAFIHPDQTSLSESE